jgi:hypothetical protein
MNLFSALQGSESDCQIIKLQLVKKVCGGRDFLVVQAHVLDTPSRRSPLRFRSCSSSAMMIC